jgi:predicted patatin/cPLA2 family phospholipase
MNNAIQPDTLILEGGSLKCAFTAGILDVFMAADYFPFTQLYGVSSGAMALSFYAANQPRNFISIARNLVEDDKFVSFTSVWSEQGMMNLQYLQRYTEANFPLDEAAATKRLKGRKAIIVTASHEDATSHYHEAKQGKWKRYLMASAALPFITKGRVKINGAWHFDGGYTDALPIQKALENGAKNILLIRTRPLTSRIDRSYTDYFGSYWHSDNEALSELFYHGHELYNASADFLASPPPKGVTWAQIAPKEALATDRMMVWKSHVDEDYRQGLEAGLSWLHHWSYGQEED